jgi:pentatricopeptide repeat protein
MGFINREGIASLPKESETQYVSVMEENESLALQGLRYLQQEGLVSAQNYDSVLQSAVRFHRPDLAWELYLEMRNLGLQPSTDTVSDLIYR